MSIRLIVGLCNPGDAYQYTRHNVGAWLVSALALRQRMTFKLDKKFHGELASFAFNGTTCHVLLPTTFMNRSGLSVRAVSQFYRISPDEMLIAHDDLDLPTGRIKLKTGGGHGGHNGLRDLVAQLGTPHFHRLRIGIGHPGHKTQVSDYVLSKPSSNDQTLITDAIAHALEHVPLMFEGRMADAMMRINTIS
jgi:PTH1 family peptidyl-tRNA hydrolase